MDMIAQTRYVSSAFMEKSSEGELFVVTTDEGNKSVVKVVSGDLFPRYQSLLPLFEKLSECPYCVQTRDLSMDFSRQRCLQSMDLYSHDLMTEIRRQPKRRLGEAQAKAYFSQVASAVQFCHENGIIHCDIKPENVLINETRQEAHLGDFGSAMFENEEGADMSGRGGSCSLGCVAPEILCGGGDSTGSSRGPGHSRSLRLSKPRRRSTAQTDIWSLGILLLGMLTGYAAPWEAAHPDHDEAFAYFLHQGGAFLFAERPDVSESARALVLGMLTISPRERLNIADVVNSPWFQECALAPPAEESKDSPPMTRRIARVVTPVASYSRTSEN